MKTARIAIAIAIGALAFAAGSASAVVLPFSEPDFNWLATGGAVIPNYIWTTGDFWAQDFPATGLTSATALTLDLNVDAGASETLNLAVFVNSINVGGFSINPADGGFQQYNFGFASIAGPGYDIDIIATNTLSSGAGSYSILVDPTGQSSFVTITPTPGALALLAPAGLFVSRRRRN